MTKTGTQDDTVLLDSTDRAFAVTVLAAIYKSLRHDEDLLFQIALLRNMKQQCVQPDKEQGCQLFSLHLTLFVTLGPLWIFCIKHGYLKRFCHVADGRQ